MTKMSAELERKLFTLRCRSKRGEWMSEAELTFCQKMYEQFPDDYKAMEPRVLEATAPFGSRQFWKE
jgi:hypothetical protein